MTHVRGVMENVDQPGGIAPPNSKRRKNGLDFTDCKSVASEF